MKLHLLPVFIFLCLSPANIGKSNANPVLSVVPTTVGVGNQGLVSTIPGGVLGSQVFTTSPQSSIIQLLRQPGVVSLNGGAGGGVTQFIVPGNGGQQILLNGAGLNGANGLAGFNGLGLTSSGGGFTTTTALVNGVQVPVLIPSGALGYQTAAVASTLPQQPAAGSLVYPFITQPSVREVTEEVLVDPQASLVQVDPMDAALLDMENKGQMHMEKYAWGRNYPVTNQNNAAVADDESLRSDLTRYYSQVPTGSIVTSQPVDVVNQKRVVANSSPTTAQSQLRNPFVDANGKRKKHFEYYQYFRNLNMNPGQALPVAVLPPGNLSNE